MLKIKSCKARWARCKQILKILKKNWSKRNEIWKDSRRQNGSFNNKDCDSNYSSILSVISTQTSATFERTIHQAKNIGHFRTYQWAQNFKRYYKLRKPSILCPFGPSTLTQDRSFLGLWIVHFTPGPSTFTSTRAMNLLKHRKVKAEQEQNKKLQNQIREMEKKIQDLGEEHKKEISNIKKVCL